MCCAQNLGKYLNAGVCLLGTLSLKVLSYSVKRSSYRDEEKRPHRGTSEPSQPPFPAIPAEALEM